MILCFSTKPQCAPLDRDASVQRKQRGHSVRGCPRHRYLRRRLWDLAQHAREVDDGRKRRRMVGAVRAPNHVEHRAVEQVGLDDGATRGGGDSRRRPNSSSRITVEGDKRASAHQRGARDASLDRLSAHLVESAAAPEQRRKTAPRRDRIGVLSAELRHARAERHAEHRLGLFEVARKHEQCVRILHRGGQRLCARADRAHDGYARRQ